MFVNHYYKAKTTNEIFTGTQLKVFKSLMDLSIPDLVKQELVAEIKDPTVEDILNANGGRNITPAILRYREVNKCGAKEASDAIRAMTNTKKQNQAKVFKNEGGNE